MMENHSYDNKLGMLKRPGADGFTIGKNGKPTATNPYKNGKIQHAFRMPTTCQLSGQPAQDWLDSHIQHDHGKLDGFVESGSGPVSMGYWQKQDQPFYYSLASTFPNRRYLMAATSLGMVNDTLPSGYPARGTIFDLLDAHRITWRNYSTTPSTLLFPDRLLRQLRHQDPPAGAVLQGRRQRAPAQLLHHRPRLQHRARRLAAGIGPGIGEPGKGAQVGQALPAPGPPRPFPPDGRGEAEFESGVEVVVAVAEHAAEQPVDLGRRHAA